LELRNNFKFGIKKMPITAGIVILINQMINVARVISVCPTPQKLK
jgi:hypothetical protein